MKHLLVVPRTLWKVYFAINFGVGLLLLYPAFRVLLSNEKWFKHAFKLKRAWAKWLVFSGGIIIKKTKHFDLSKIKEPVVYCANHTSYLDIAISYAVVPNYFAYMGKKELSRAPLFNIFFRKMNVLVDRHNKKESYKAVGKSVEQIKKGNSMFLYPEGTFVKQGYLLPLKTGAFKLALQTGAPIVPITFIDNWKRLQSGSFFKAKGGPGFVRAIIHEPIVTKGMKEEDLLPLMEKVKNIFLEDLKKYS